MIDDVVIGREHAVREPVVAHELPDILLRVQLGAARRQGDDGDVPGHVELVGGMPAGLIHEQHGVGAGGDRKRDLGEVEVHRLGVAERQDQPRSFALHRADRAEDVGRLGSLVVRRRRARSPLRPAACDLVLLPDPGLILEPDLYWRAAREGRADLVQ